MVRLFVFFDSTDETTALFGFAETFGTMTVRETVLDGLDTGLRAGVDGIDDVFREETETRPDRLLFVFAAVVVLALLTTSTVRLTRRAGVAAFFCCAGREAVFGAAC